MRRRGDHQVNTDLVSILSELNNSLEKAEIDLIGNENKVKYPVLFIIGPPRAGTTLVMQWLCNMGIFAYPTNLMSRFYKAPYIGHLIQKIISDDRMDYQNELYDLKPEKKKFKSRLGKTEGSQEPNGFWYLWRRFIPTGEIARIPSQKLDKIDRKGLMNAVASIEMAYDRPVVLKGKMMQYNIDELIKIFTNAIFIHVKRDTIYNAQSILSARVEYFGDPLHWYGGKPPGYEKLLSDDAYKQVVGQVVYTNAYIEDKLGNKRNNGYIELTYEEFCSNPKIYFNKVEDKMRLMGYPIRNSYKGVDGFDNKNKIKISETDFEYLRDALSSFI